MRNIFAYTETDYKNYPGYVSYNRQVRQMKPRKCALCANLSRRPKKPMRYPATPRLAIDKHENTTDNAVSYNH